MQQARVAPRQSEDCISLDLGDAYVTVDVSGQPVTAGQVVLVETEDGLHVGRLVGPVLEESVCLRPPS